MTQIIAAEKKIRNIVAYISPSFFGTILSFISFPIMTRFLTPKDWGIIALLGSFPTFVVSLLTLNVQAGAERYYFEYRKDAKSLSMLISTTITFMLIVFIMSVPVFYLARNFIATMVLGGDGYGRGVFLSYLTCCFALLLGFYLMLYRNMEEAKKFSFYTIIQMGLNVALNLLLVVVFRLGYMGVVYATLITTFVVFVLLFWRFQKEYPLNFNVKMLSDNLKYGIPLLPSSFTGFIYDFLDKFLLRSIISLASTGIYSIGVSIMKKFSVIMAAIQATFFPTFMQDMFDRGKKAAVSIGRNFTIFSYLSLGPILVMILFGEELVHILAPRSYDGAIYVLIIMLCALSAQTFGKIVGVQLAYVKRAYLGFPLSIVQLVTMILFNLLLIPRWGAVGAGLASTISLIIMNALLVIISQSYYKIIYEKKILILMYLNIFLAAISVSYLQTMGVFFLLKYCIKTIFLVLFVFLGVRINILTNKNIKVAFNVLTFKKALAPLKTPEIIQGGGIYELET